MNQQFTLQSKIDALRANQKSFNARMAQKGIDTTYRPIDHLLANDSQIAIDERNKKDKLSFDIFKPNSWLRNLI